MKVFKEGTTSMINQNIFKIKYVIKSKDFLECLLNKLKNNDFDECTLGNDICHAINCINGNAEVAHNLTEVPGYLKIEINGESIDLNPIYIKSCKSENINMQQSATLQDMIDSACTVTWQDNGIYY